MKITCKEIRRIIFLITMILLCFFLWLTHRPVKIIAVHNNDNFSDVLVDHFPLTTQGKITWWQENKDILKSRYDIPDMTSNRGYNITFWLFGDGYMEPDEDDNLCFTDMKTKKNCIEKNKTFTVDYSKNTGVFFTTYSGYHRLDDNGKIVRKSFN